MRKLLFTVLLFFSFLLPLRAEETVYTESSTGYRAVVDDRCGLLSADEIRQLTLDMMPITKYGNAAFITDWATQSTNKYAEKRYNELFGDASGTIFVIDMANRNIWIYSRGEVYRTITKAYANTITDNVYRHASNGEYYACANRVFEQEETLLRGGRIARPMKHITNALTALIGGVLLNFAVLALTRDRRKKPGIDEGMAIETAAAVTAAGATLLNTTKRYSPRSSGGSGSGSSSGGGGGGFSGGSSSGGGGGHSF